MKKFAVILIIIGFSPIWIPIMIGAMSIAIGVTLGQRLLEEMAETL